MMYTSGAVVILALASLVTVSEAQFGVRGGQQASRQAIDQEKLHEALSASEQGLDAHQAILQANQNIEEVRKRRQLNHVSPRNIVSPGILKSPWYHKVSQIIDYVIQDEMPCG